MRGVGDAEVPAREHSYAELQSACSLNRAKPDRFGQDLSGFALFGHTDSANSAEISAVGGDDLLIPVEATLQDSTQVIILIHIHESVSLLEPFPR